MEIRNYLHLLTGRCTCLLCGRLDKYAITYGICLSCQRSLLREETVNRQRNVCGRCGMALLSEKDYCTECRRTPDAVRNHTIYDYRGSPKDLIRFYKFQDHKKLSLFFARRIHKSLIHMNYTPEEWAIVPIPPGKGKIFRKGWDQIDLIVKQLAKKGWQRADPLLNRGKRVQKSLDRENRLKESINRYTLKKNATATGKIILIDDVFTTGATIKACTYALREGGAEQVRSLTIARD